MSKPKHNTNMPVVRRAVALLGGTVVEEKTDGGKHIRVRVRTAIGTEFWLTVMRAKADPYKQTGWVRQQMARADARVEHNKREHNR